MGAEQSTSEVVFRAFLSHRYESPEVNEYFYQWFAAAEANPQFAVDKSERTSVTRLERLIRGADGFIGIYPFPDGEEATIDRLKYRSRYFRLELDLAERAGKPALVFIDSRYGSVIGPPPPIMTVRFKREEILAHAQSPRAGEFKRRVDDFCRWVAAARAYKSSYTLDEEKLKIGILLPPEDSSGDGYNRRHIELLEAEIENSTSPREVEILKWPPVLGSSFAAKSQAFDWIVVDMGGASAASGIVAYLHGRFIPMLRLMRVPESVPMGVSTPLIEALYGGYEVGYLKDIIRWSDEEALRTQMKERIEILDAEQELFATLLEAQQYFRRAKKRDEEIFVSYSSTDAEDAEELIKALKQRFRHVFDYRDIDSIPGGASWMSEIFKKIDETDVGVLLYSPSYFGSDNCMHEARTMLARRDNRKMKVVPVRLQQGDLDMPAEFRDPQYLGRWKYPDWGTLVGSIIQSIGG